MRAPEPTKLESLSPSDMEWVNAVCNEFEDEWGRDTRPGILDYVKRAGDATDPAVRMVLLRELLAIELEMRQEDAQAHDLDHYRALFSDPAEIQVLESVMGGAAREEGAMRFRVVRPHAEGGLGEIFVAHDEQLDRMVALKRIRPEHVDHESSRARFVREARITGRLEHPNIAPVYAQGRDRDNRPFYAMRFIDGEPFERVIANFHEAHPAGSDPGPRQLGLRKLLGNFITVCNAVAFAHDRGVLHRDIKPHNVMQGPFGETILVDWGLAKEIGSPTVDPTSSVVPGADTTEDRFSEAGSVLGTLSYMSPEQAGATTSQIGPATDIYSLGATLYHLLTGRPPFAGKDHDEIRRKVIAGDFRPPREVDRTIPRELDAIVRMAMALEPGDRYATATALAEDIEHWLAGEPITAWREPLLYRARRAMSRHRVLVYSTAAGLLVGVVGLAGFAMMLASKNTELEIQRLQVSHQRDRAESEAANAKAVNDFLNNDVLAQASAESQANPDTKPDPDLKVRTALDRAAKRIEGKFTGKPLVEASIRRTIGVAYQRLGLNTEALLHLERALELNRLASDNEDPETLETMHAVGEHYLVMGKPDSAEPMLVAVLEGMRRLRGADHPATLGIMIDLGNIYMSQGRPGEAELLFTQSLKGLRKSLGNDDLQTVMAMNNIGKLYQLQGRLAEAEPFLVDAVAGLTKAHGLEHPDTLIAKNNLAQLYLLQGKRLEAESTLSQVLEVRSRVLGPDHPDTLDTKSDLAMVYGYPRSPEKVEPLLKEVLEGRRRTQGADHRDTLRAMANLAVFYHIQRQPSKAEGLLDEALKRSRRVYGANNADTLSLMQNLGALYQVGGRLEKATPLLTEAVKGLQTTLGADHTDTLQAMSNLAALYDSLGKPAEAESLLLHVLDVQKRNLGAEHIRTLGMMQALAVCYVSQGKYNLAEPLFVEALEGRRRKLGDNDPATLDTMGSLGWLRLRLGKLDAAESLLRECLEIRDKTMPDNWLRFDAASRLGACLVAEKKYADAEPLLISAYHGLKDRENLIPPAQKTRVSEAGDRIIQLFDAQGNKEKAGEWRKKLSSPTSPSPPAVPPKP
jgi:eukaryotic-like serine/threonine-protein kinase